jgi:hypothetical protein
MATAWLFGLHLVAWPGSRGVFDLAASITWALIISRLETLSSSSYLTLRPDNSLGVSKDRPSIDSGSLRPLRCFCLEEVAFLFCFRTSACLCHRAGPVPPSRFLTALMVCSARSFAGLLHPAADPGFAEFRARSWGPLRAPGFLPFPSTRAPFEAFPSPVAVSRFVPPGRSCPPVIRCFLAGPKTFASSKEAVSLATHGSSSDARLGTVQLQGFGPLVESAFAPECFHPNTRAASMGFFFCRVIRFLSAGSRFRVQWRLATLSTCVSSTLLILVEHSGASARGANTSRRGDRQVALSADAWP